MYILLLWKLKFCAKHGFPYDFDRTPEPIKFQLVSIYDSRSSWEEKFLKFEFVDKYLDKRNCMGP